MGVATAPQSPSWTVGEFRAFYESRPDEERWELIDGVAILMTPPTLAHQRIASNLQRLLNEALERHDPSRFAYQRIGVDLEPEVERYHPEPDVAVIDAAHEQDQRYGRRFYLAAEVVSDSDRERIRRGPTRVEAKRRVYRRHPTFTSVLLISQNEIRVELDRVTDEGWRTSVLRDAHMEVVLPDFGLSCTVGDLYRGTPLVAATRA